MFYTIFFFLFLFVSISAAQDCNIPSWHQNMIDNNMTFSKLISLEEIQTNFFPIEKQSIAIIGDGIDENEFTDLISLNELEIPDNNIDDDGNGFVDDYYGYDFNKKTGNHFNSHGYFHDMRIAGLIRYFVGPDCRKNKMIKILPLKVNSDNSQNNSHNYMNVADAIDYAVDRGVRIISISMGTSAENKYFFSFKDNNYEKSVQYIQSAIERAHSKGVIVVAAVSNDPYRNHDREAEYPANFPSVISVGNLNFDKTLSSGFGRSVQTAFFGRFLLWTPPNSFEEFNGTSYAAPLLATAIAMRWSADPKIPHSEMVRLIMHAQSIPVKGRKKIGGYGFDMQSFFSEKLK